MSANRVEKLVYWYLRFNGYLTVENFTIHPDYKKSPEAEADILAVRFPNSEEEPRGFHFERNPKLVLNDHVDFIIGEVKTGLCSINHVWENSELKNIQYALNWLGFLEDSEVDSVANTIYNNKTWQNEIYSVRLICFGARENTNLDKKYPQLLHRDMFKFVYDRLTTDCMALHRENWDPFIQEITSRIKADSFNDILDWILSKD